MDYTYIEAIKRTGNVPDMLSTYVDDAWLVWTHGRPSFDEFLQHLNSIWDTVKFEVELENPDNQSINFLDITISRTADNMLKYEFYQKATHSGKYLHFDSHCPLSTKINIIKSETNRIIGNCMDRNDIWPHLEKMKQDFIASGYNNALLNQHILEIVHHTPRVNKQSMLPAPHFILRVPYINEKYTRLFRKALKDSNINARLVVSSGKPLKSFLKPKSSELCNELDCQYCTEDIPCTTHHYVYKFRCRLCTDEDVEYVGASRRATPNRFKQHEASVRRFNDRTSLGQHMIAQHPDLKPAEIKREKPQIRTFFERFQPEILRKCSDTLDTFITEGLMISALRPKLNNMNSNGFLSVFE